MKTNIQSLVNLLYIMKNNNDACFKNLLNQNNMNAIKSLTEVYEILNDKDEEFEDKLTEIPKNRNDEEFEII